MVSPPLAHLDLAFPAFRYLNVLQPDILLAMKSHGFHHDAGFDFILRCGNTGSQGLRKQLLKGLRI